MPHGPYAKDPEFRRKWHENAGRWSDKEKAAEAGRKGAAVSNARKRAQKQMREILTNPDGFREEAMTAILEEHPDALDKLAQTIYKEALGGDKQAMMMAVKLFGMEAPKKQEITVQEEMSPEEAMRVLMQAQEGDEQ